MAFCTYKFIAVHVQFENFGMRTPVAGGTILGGPGVRICVCAPEIWKCPRLFFFWPVPLVIFLILLK